MTALCAGGTSSAKPGFARLLYVAPWVIAGLITDIPPAAAAAIGGAIGSTFYDLDSLCVTDPPSMPTITTDDVAALFQPFDLPAFIPARQKFQDWLFNLAWRQFCQCDNGTVPGAVTTPAAVASFNPTPSVGPVTQASGFCFDGTAYSVRARSLTAGPTIGSGGSGVTTYLLSPRLFSQPSINRSETGYTGQFPTYVVPGAPAFGQISGHVYSGGTGRAQQILISLFTWLANGSQQGVSIGNTVPAANGDFSLLLAGFGSTPAYMALAFELMNSDPDCVVDVRLRLSGPACGNGVVQPCCPPDPSLAQQIDQIYQLVQLIQRQGMPFAYIGGAVHAGLTGEGSISVQGLIGARFELTSTSSAQGQLVGDPAVVFNAGWFNWGNADGVTAREFLSAAEQVSFPAAAGQYTSIHYSLEPGVTLSITELVREP